MWIIYLRQQLWEKRESITGNGVGYMRKKLRQRLIGNEIGYLIVLFAILYLTGCKEGESDFKGSSFENALLFTIHTSDNSYNRGFYKEIYVIDPPDTNKVRITYNDKMEEYPVWLSNDQIAFRRHRGIIGKGTPHDLISINLLTCKEDTIIKDEHSAGRISADEKGNLYISSINGIYKYEQVYEWGWKELFNMEDIGIDKNSNNITCWVLGVSVRKSKIVFAFTDKSRIDVDRWEENGWRYGDKFIEIGIANYDGTDFRKITNDTFPDWKPAISSDRRYIAYTSERPPYITIRDTILLPWHRRILSKRKYTIWEHTEPNFDIYIADLQTDHIRRLTTHIAKDTSPTWSPDGEKIAFISDRDGHDHIWIINTDGTGLYQLTRGNYECSNPCWSPR